VTVEAGTPRTFAEYAAAEIDGPLCFSLMREMVPVTVVARFTLEGEPASKQRPRFTQNKNGSVYTPEKTRTMEDRVGWAFRQVAGPQRLDPSQGFGVYVAFFCSSGQRRDVDNMIKLVLDGLNGVAWLDDSQVTEISAKVGRWQPSPRTEVVIYRTAVVVPPPTACENCGRMIKTYPSRPRRWSNACATIARTVGMTCPQCGAEFRVKPDSANRGQRHCSTACRRAAAQAELVHLTCAGCGKGFTLRPSEHAARPGRAYCTVACRRVHG
jgi:crossover junction endodeoxyribonuclease RusA